MYYNTRMVFTGLRRAGGIALAFAGLALLLWGIWPARQITHGIPYSYGKELALPSGWEGLQPPPSLADGIFSMQWPAWIRLGDEGKIRLELQDSGSQAFCPEVAGSAAFTLNGRLELPGIALRPGSELTQPIIPCKPLFQAWVVQAGKSRLASGTLWLHLGAVGLPGNTKPELALAAVPLEIPLISLLGLSGAQARLVGVLAILVGLALNIDLLVRRT